MAKKDKKGSVLPKIVAGVKMPKALRKQGHHLAALARHPLAADIIAAALVAIAAHLRDDPKVKKAAAKVTEAAGDTAEQVTAEVAKAATKVKKAAAKAVDTPAKKAAAPKKKAPPPPPRPRAPRRPASKTTH